MVRFSYDIQNCIGKYGTNRLRIHRSVYESGTDKGKFSAVLDIRYKMSFTTAWALLPK